MPPARIPVTLLTGFLGSGKTTLLNKWVQQPEFARSLIIINEFGDVSLDHLLVAHSADQSVVELAGGCLCCTVRGDLQKTLIDARWRFARGGQRQFDRVIIETTGLADPVPIINTLTANDTLARHYQWQGVVTTVDALQGADTLARFPEAVRQVVFADLVLITKSDETDVERSEALKQQIQSMNPSADLLTTSLTTTDPLVRNRLFSALSAVTSGAVRPSATNGVPGLRIRKIHTLVSRESAEAPHQETMTSFSWIAAQPIDARDLAVWWAFVQANAGEKLLRLKALIQTTDYQSPQLMQIVQHRVHPTIALADWPTTDHRSRIVVIGQTDLLDSIATATEHMSTHRSSETG